MRDDIGINLENMQAKKLYFLYFHKAWWKYVETPETPVLDYLSSDPL
jgi:hypothetical protein